MAQMRVNYGGPTSPSGNNYPQRVGSENFNVMNEHQGAGGISILSNQPLSDGKAARDHEKKQNLRIANAEIEELKAGLNYAEYELAKIHQEKEQIEQQRHG